MQRKPFLRLQGSWEWRMRENKLELKSSALKKQLSIKLNPGIDVQQFMAELSYGVESETASTYLARYGYTEKQAATMIQYLLKEGALLFSSRKVTTEVKDQRHDRQTRFF